MLLKKYETIPIWHETKGVLNVNLKDIDSYLKQKLFHRSEDDFKAKSNEAVKAKKEAKVAKTEVKADPIKDLNKK